MARKLKDSLYVFDPPQFLSKSSLITNVAPKHAGLSTALTNKSYRAHQQDFLHSQTNSSMFYNSFTL